MNAPKPRQFDLEERTAAFGNSAILLAKTIPLTPITRPLPESKEPARKLWQEAEELNLIFNAIIRTTTANAESNN